MIRAFGAFSRWAVESGGMSRACRATAERHCTFVFPPLNFRLWRLASLELQRMPSNPLSVERLGQDLGVKVSAHYFLVGATELLSCRSVAAIGSPQTDEWQCRCKFLSVPLGEPQTATHRCTCSPGASVEALFLLPDGKSCGQLGGPL